MQRKVVGNGRYRRAAPGVLQEETEGWRRAGRRRDCAGENDAGDHEALRKRRPGRGPASRGARALDYCVRRAGDAVEFDRGRHFPEVSAGDSEDSDKEIIIKRDPLIHALRKAVVLTSEETKTVSLKFSPGTCLIEARSPDKGQASVTLEVEYSGDPVSIGFNPQYLQDALKVLDSETVRLELKDGSKPGVLREGTDFLYVLMPVNPKD